MEFSRQEYWNGLLFPSPGDLPNPRIEPGSPTLQADSLPPEPSMKAFSIVITYYLKWRNQIYIERVRRESKQQFHGFMVMDDIAFSLYLLKIQSIDWGTSVVTTNLGSSLPPSPIYSAGKQGGHICLVGLPWDTKDIMMINVLEKPRCFMKEKVLLMLKWPYGAH